MAPRKKHSALKNYFLPHEGNGFHPKLFRRAAVVTLVIAIFVIEGLYVADTKLALNHQGFLASVLPAALLDLTNADREASGVAPLTSDPQLAEAAQLKANDMAQKGYFAHVSPDGNTPWHWLDAVGYRYSYAGENLAVNFDDSSTVESAWMNSPTHHANLVKPQYTRVGYAVAQGMYQGKETTFVVQMLATKPTDATITATPKAQNPVAVAVNKVVSVVSPKAAEQPEVVTAGPAAQTPEVAGSQTGQQTTAAPVNTGKPMILASNQGQTTTSDSWLGHFLKQVSASPLRATIYVLGALVLIMAVLLVLALTAHASVRYLEVLAGGLIVIIFSLSVLAYNATHAPVPILPGPAAATTSVR